MIYNGGEAYGLNSITDFLNSKRNTYDMLFCNLFSSTVARGFAARAIKYTRWLEDKVARLLDGGVAHLESFVVSGHSLGGPAAQGLAYWFAQKYPSVKLSVYTFESPRLGNVVFYEHYSKRVPHTFTHTFDVDIVPMAAPWMVGAWTVEVRFGLRNRCAILGCNPMNWLMTLHLDSYKVFVPWMLQAYPRAYETAWAELQNLLLYYNGSVTTVAKLVANSSSPGYQPEYSADRLSTSQFVTFWTDRLSRPVPCTYKVFHTIAASFMQGLLNMMMLSFIYMLWFTLPIAASTAWSHSSTLIIVTGIFVVSAFVILAPVCETAAHTIGQSQQV